MKERYAHLRWVNNVGAQPSVPQRKKPFVAYHDAMVCVRAAHVACKMLPRSRLCCDLLGNATWMQPAWQ
jgi:hypothetical protein